MHINETNKLFYSNDHSHQDQILKNTLVLILSYLARHFLSRALLAAENFYQVESILRDTGCGAGDGCSVNMTFLNQEGDRVFHNAEIAPADKTDESQLNILTTGPGETMVHCNR